MTGDVLLMSAPRYRRRTRLPVREVAWFADRRVDCQPRAKATILQPGYRKGEPSANRGKRFPATPPTRDEMLRLLDACGGGKTGIRNRALLIVLWRAGLRISEALALLPHDIDYDTESVTVLCGKGGKRRTVGIDSWALEQIQDWYVERKRIGVPEGSLLFCCVAKGSVGQPMNSGYVRALCGKLRVRANIPHRVAPHQLRHGLACELHREGVSVHLIQKQLGHANLGMTANYLAGLAPEDVFRAMSARPAPESTR